MLSWSFTCRAPDHSLQLDTEFLISGVAGFWGFFSNHVIGLVWVEGCLGAQMWTGVMCSPWVMSFLPVAQTLPWGGPGQAGLALVLGAARFICAFSFNDVAL